MAWCLGQCAKHDPHSWVNTGEERRAAQHTRRFSLCLPNLCPVQQCLCALCSFMLECKHENPNKDQNIVSGAHVIITGSLTFVCFGFFTHTMCVLLKKKKKNQHYDRIMSPVRLWWRRRFQSCKSAAGDRNTLYLIRLNGEDVSCWARFQPVNLTLVSSFHVSLAFGLACISVPPLLQ